MDNIPDWIYETKPMLREAVAKHPFWKLDLETTQYVSFRAADWYEFPSSRTGTGWAPESDALLLFQLRFDGDLPYLDLELSPPIPATLRSGKSSSMLSDKTPPYSNPPATPSPTAG